MKVTVLGATGVLGRQVVPRLIEHGHQVSAVVLREEQIPHLGRIGVKASLGDILEPESLLSAMQGSDPALHLATSIPRRDQAQDWSANDRIRRQGSKNLIAAAQANRLARYIQQSITLLYGDHGREVIDETATPQPTPITESAIEMEATVRPSSLEWVILRGGLFYGPGTGSEESWRSSILDEEFRLPGNGNGMLSLIHVVDMSRAVVQVLEGTERASIFNVVDDNPTSVSQLYGFVAWQEGVPSPKPGVPRHLPSLACTNESIKQALGWEPTYPSFRSGLAR